MVRVCFPGGSWMAALMVILLALSPLLAWARDTPPFFVVQMKGECHFSNGTERVRLLARYFYGREEYLRFDSDVGRFIAVTELGRPDADHYNKDEDVLEQMRAQVDTVCRHNYEGSERFLVHRQTAPTVTVHPAKTQHLQHHNLLVCSVNGFYPGHIEVRWLRNGQEEETGVISTGLIRNGDWTFQILVMLETVPQSGEVYTCQVQHPSQTGPVTVEWRAQSEAAQSKMLSGVGGFVLGLLFLGVGLFVYFRNQKGHSGLQPTAWKVFLLGSYSTRRAPPRDLLWSWFSDPADHVLPADFLSPCPNLEVPVSTSCSALLPSFPGPSGFNPYCLLCT